jgi:hypothetical protein
VTVPHRHYLFLHIKQDQVGATMAFISKKYGQYITTMAKVHKEDLDLHNHLVGLKQLYVKIEFLTATDQQKVRRDLLAAYRRNREEKQRGGDVTRCYKVEKKAICEDAEEIVLEQFVRGFGIDCADFAHRMVGTCAGQVPFPHHPTNPLCPAK